MQRQKKRTGSSKLRSKFETLRREIKADVRKQHDLYVNNLVGDVKANPRDFYRYINSQKSCKLLEHIVYSNIMAHLDEYKLLSDRQHAFRKGHSCETQLTTVINDWAKILDNRGQVDTFILDFEKAFDTPPHELLKSKLFSYGIGGKTLKWIDSFLCFRQQRVVVNGVKSDWAPVL